MNMFMFTRVPFENYDMYLYGVSNYSTWLVDIVMNGMCTVIA